MLINQNHELSIKLKKKTETINSLNSLLKQTLEGKQVYAKDPPNLQQEESFSSEYKWKSDNRETERPQNVLRTSSSAEIFSNTTGPSGLGRLFS